MTEICRSSDAAKVLGVAFLIFTQVTTRIHASDSESRDGVAATSPALGKPAEVVSTSNQRTLDWGLKTDDPLPEEVLLSTRGILHRDPNSDGQTWETGSTNSGDREHRQERLIVENPRYMDKLGEFGWDDIALLNRVRITLYPEWYDQPSLCWFISETKSTITVLQDDLSVETIPEVEGLEIQEFDYASEIIDWMEAKIGRSDRNHTINERTKSKPPSRGGLLLLRHTDFARHQTLPDESSHLSASAFEVDFTTRIHQFDQQASKTFQRGMQALLKSGDRKLARTYWNRVLTRYPDSDYDEQCRNYVRTLDRMAAEDVTFREPHNLKQLSETRRAAYWIHLLREVKVEQHFSPGHCHVLGYGTTDESPARQLAHLGKPAVPLLIALLDDDRLTRSYGSYGGFSSWDWGPQWVLEYRDASIQILEYIANEQFYRPRSTASVFSNEKPDRQAAVIAKVKAWWQKNKERDESAWLRESLERNGIGYSGSSHAACRRLIAFEGARSIGFFRQRQAAEPDNGRALEMLWLAGQSQVIPDLLEVAKSDKMSRRVSAYRILQKAEHPQYLRLALDEYRALAETPEPERREYRDAARSLTYQLAHSNEQVAIDEVCRVLREGSTLMSIYSYNVLEQIREPWVLPHLASRLHDNRSNGRDRLSDRAARTLIARYKLPWKLEPHASQAERDKIIEKVRQWWKTEEEKL